MVILTDLDSLRNAFAISGKVIVKPYVQYVFVLENGHPLLAGPIYTVLNPDFMQR